MNPARESIATEQFGPYEVYERLGMGGMASVHRAKKRGPAGFERTVALKRMLSHLTEDRGFIESFVREAKVASLLVHPNIAQVYDFGRINQVFYIAMELVAGFDLRKILRHAHKTGEAIPLGVILSILAELCDALDYAHSFVDENGQHLNIVHRDISPSNIIVAHTGHVKVIDFGIAKASSRQLHTETGMVKGKLGYMAPEAAMGMSVSAQSDMFSIGVTAWELVTALPLFSARTDFETMRKLREEPVTPPSYNNPACPPRLDRLILASLAREPEQRIPSARVFRNEIDMIAQECNVQLSARAVANWTARLAEAEATSRASTANDVARMRSPSGRSLPLPPEPETAISRPKSSTRPQTLRRSDEDLALATEIWGEDNNGTSGASGPDFSMDSVPPIAAATHDPRVMTAPNVPALPAIGNVQGYAPSHPSQQHGFTPAHPSQHPSTPHGFTPSQPSYPQQYTPSHPSMPGYPPAHPSTQNLPPGATFNPGTQSFPPGAYAEPTKSKAPLMILSVLAIAAGVLGALLFLKRSHPQPHDVGLKFNIEPKGAIVEVAGKEIGSGSPLATRLTPGVYSINVHSDGYKPWTTSLAVREGEDQTINIVLDHADTVAVAPPQPPQPQTTQPPVDTKTDEPQTTQPSFDPFVDATPDKPDAGTKPGHHHSTSRHETTSHHVSTPTKPDDEETAKPDPVVKQDPPKPDPVVKQDPPKPDPVVKQDPPKPDPVVDNKPKTVPGVAPTAVTKVSGDIPVLHGNASGASDVLAKMCIDESGRVSSVQVKKAPAEITAELQRALQSWRYKPYMKGSTPIAVCFPLQLRVVLK